MLIPIPDTNLSKRTLSPRAYKIFNLIVAALISLAAWQVYTGSGWMASLAKWAIGFAGGDAVDDAKAVFAVAIVPILATAAAAAYLHDFVFKFGLFGPKQPTQLQPPKPPRPPDRLRDW